jgi:hypothetical protein
LVHFFVKFKIAFRCTILKYISDAILNFPRTALKHPISQSFCYFDELKFKILFQRTSLVHLKKISNFASRPAGRQGTELEN